MLKATNSKARAVFAGATSSLGTEGCLRNLRLPAAGIFRDMTRFLFLPLSSITRADKVYVDSRLLGIFGSFASYFVVAEKFVWGLRNRVQRE